MRSRASFRILQRRAVAEPDEREELIELAVAVNGERLAAERIEGDGVFGDDRSEEHAHARDSDISPAGSAHRACTKTATPSASAEAYAKKSSAFRYAKPNRRA